MPVFDLQEFAVDGIIREQTLRDAFARYNWETLRGKTVHIRGCGEIAVPSWAYIMAAAYIARVARKISFGEEQSPIPIIDVPPETAGEDEG
jgi:hypothetical protein